MVPREFARGVPRAYRLPDQWDMVESRYAALAPHPSLDWILTHVRAMDADRALIEHEYLDGDYRTEYANFYIQTHRRLPDRCERIHFWAADRYLGFSSIRPIAGHPVCRTMLDPGADFESAVSCAVREAAHPYGRNLTVPGFPFISQDGQYARCAHAVIWMVAKYHHLQHHTPQRTMSDIVNAAARDETERVVPSRGLLDHQIGSVLRQIGLGAIQYRLRTDDGNGPELEDGDAVEALVLRYLNSGIPLLLGTPGHLTALIGARRDAPGDPLTLVRCDDENGPYCEIGMQLDAQLGGSADRDSLDVWDQLFVPLPGRIFLLGEELQPHASEIFGHVLGHPRVDRPSLEGRRLRVREYVTDSRAYKSNLPTRGIPLPVAVRHQQISAPRWIWVVELQDEDLAERGQPSVIAELAFDATSSAERPLPLWSNVPGVHVAWSDTRDHPIFTPVEAEIGPFTTGTILGL